MEKLWEILTGSGIAGAAAVVLVSVAAHYLRPKERRLRKLERLSALRANLGERGEELDEELDRLVGHVTQDLDREELRIEQRLVTFLASLGGLWGLGVTLVSIIGPLTYVEAAVGIASRSTGVTTGLGILTTCTIAIALAHWTFPVIYELRERQWKRNRERRAAASAEEVAGEGDEPRAGVNLDAGAAAPRHAPLDPTVDVRGEDSEGGR